MSSHHDGTIEELQPKIDALLKKFQYALTWIKWTCPGCGDRVTADNHNTFHNEGYLHTTRENGLSCGATYGGPLYGFRLVVSYSAEAREAVLAAARIP